jgi:predicted regulator of Ras-like GTPase activity (Roadblock/LC7/MglB family)
MMTAHGTGSLRKAVDNMALDGYIDKPFTMQQIRQIVKTAVSKTEVDDPYRSGEHYIEDAVSDQMKALQSDTGARCVMLLSAAGYPIETVGTFEGVDTSTVGALVAANFMAAVELSKLLGQHSVFKSSYHEGPDYNIYSYDIDGDVLLAVIFGPETKTGAVWFFTKQTAASLAEMEINAPSGAAIVTEDLDSITEEFEATFSQTEADEIDSVAPNAEDTQNDDGLMDLQDAISAGLVPPELLDLTKAESPDPGDPEAE